MRLHSLFFLAAAGLIVGLQPTSAGAATRNPWTVNWSAPQAGPTGARDAVWQVSFLPGPPAAGSMAAALPAVDPPSADRADAQAGAPAPVAASVAAAEDSREQAPRARPRAFEYSHAYEVRRKIHVYASYATLPLFGAEIWLGEKLYSGKYDPYGGTRGAHGVVAGSLAALFGVNTITGVWNLKEGWKDPSHRKRRLVHGLLMLGSDAGFVATGLMAPGKYGGGNRVGHRSMVYVSVGAATVGYLMMLFAR